MNPWKIIGWILLGLMMLSLTFCGLVCVRVAQDTSDGVVPSTRATSPAVSRPIPSDCGPLADNAVSIMKARQAGMDMAKVMKAVEDTGNSSKARELVIQAYDSPRFATEKHQTRAVDDFRNDTYLACIKG